METVLGGSVGGGVGKDRTLRGEEDGSMINMCI
jgi:hypothetical protein